MKKIIISAAAIVGLAPCFANVALADSQGFTVSGTNTAQCLMTTPPVANWAMPANTLFDANSQAKVVTNNSIAVTTVTCNTTGAEFGIRSANGAMTHNGAPFMLASDPRVDYTATLHVAGEATTPSYHTTTSTAGGPYASDVHNMAIQPSAASVTLDFVTDLGTSTLPAGTYQDTVTIWVGNP